MPPQPRVAAVCWRHHAGRGLEFLLVRTSARDRWTFPKGRLEPDDPTPGDGARREAREEAGVDGLTAPTPLRTYHHVAHLANGRYLRQPVEAWLLRVTHPAGPPEPGRQPTWFSPAAAHQALAENQSGPEPAAELQAVLAAAVQLLQMNAPAEEPAAPLAPAPSPQSPADPSSASTSAD